MKRILPFLGLFVLLFLSGLTYSQDNGIIKEIDKLIKKCQEAELPNHAKEVMLGTFLSSNDEISDWQICDPKKDNICNDESHLYFINKKLSSVHIRLGTPTGDWGTHTYYCYRENETLAYIEQNDWSFAQGSIKIDARIYLDLSGKKIKEIIKCSDIETNKPIKDIKGLYYPPEIYLTTKEILAKFKKDLKGAVPPWTSFK